MSKHERQTVRERRTGRTDEREHSPTECPECTATGSVYEDGGETVCRECGAVVEETVVDRGPEWRAFDAQERDQKRRVGAPTTKTLHDRGLSSVIGWRDEDAAGRSLSPEKREQMQRLRTWDERFRAKDAADRNLRQALGEVERMASALGLPDDVRETASVVYRRALEADLLPGRSIESMATAALFVAARQTGVPRTMDECARVSRVDRTEFARAYRYIQRELELAVEPADPIQYLPRFASALDLEEPVRQRARSLLEAGRAEGVYSGKSPVGLAAAAIYAASMLVGENLPQKEVGDVVDVSAVTIRNRYRELLRADGEW